MLSFHQVPSAPHLDSEATAVNSQWFWVLGDLPAEFDKGVSELFDEGLLPHLVQSTFRAVLMVPNPRNTVATSGGVAHERIVSK